VVSHTNQKQHTEKYLNNISSLSLNSILQSILNYHFYTLPMKTPHNQDMPVAQVWEAPSSSLNISDLLQQQRHQFSWQTANIMFSSHQPTPKNLTEKTIERYYTKLACTPKYSLEKFQKSSHKQVKRFIANIPWVSRKKKHNIFSICLRDARTLLIDFPTRSSSKIYHISILYIPIQTWKRFYQYSVSEIVKSLSISTQ